MSAIPQLTWSMKPPHPTLVRTRYFTVINEALSEENAVSLIVNGFCKDVFAKLPMEFAVEANKLMEVSLEGSVG